MNTSHTGNDPAYNQFADYNYTEKLLERNISVLFRFPPQLEDKFYTNLEELESKEVFDSFENYLQSLAKDAPGIEAIRESTKNLPSFSKLISEERENE